MNWEVYPAGLYQVLQRVQRDYHPATIYISENGAAFEDTINAAGEVDDPGRLAYLQGHIGAVERAIGAGVPVQGYFVWSLMDNFEWRFGYSKRFGIVYVDYPTQRRIIKRSGQWYRDMIREISRQKGPVNLAD
jgi:beta-glucosidase